VNAITEWSSDDRHENLLNLLMNVIDAPVLAQLQAAERLDERLICQSSDITIMVRHNNEAAKGPFTLLDIGHDVDDDFNPQQLRHDLIGFKGDPEKRTIRLYFMTTQAYNRAIGSSDDDEMMRFGKPSKEQSGRLPWLVENLEGLPASMNEANVYHAAATHNYTLVCLAIKNSYWPNVNPKLGFAAKTYMAAAMARNLPGFKDITSEACPVTKQDWDASQTHEALRGGTFPEYNGDQGVAIVTSRNTSQMSEMGKMLGDAVVTAITHGGGFLPQQVAQQAVDNDTFSKEEMRDFIDKKEGELCHYISEHCTSNGAAVSVSKAMKPFLKAFQDKDRKTHIIEMYRLGSEITDSDERWNAFLSSTDEIHNYTLPDSQVV